MTDMNKLKGRIFEKGFNFTSFSEAVNMSRPCLRNKIKGVVDFKASEIERICAVLDINSSEVSKYFFCTIVP